MAKVEIFTTMLCPYCHAAKRLLAKKGITFEEIDVTMNPAGRARMAERAGGRRSVPQIFINDAHVGGCDDLYKLDGAGKLESLVAA